MAFSGFPPTALAFYAGLEADNTKTFWTAHRQEFETCVRAPMQELCDALVGLLTDDVFMSMPPMPFEYEGPEAVGRFSASIFRAGRRFDLVPARANGQPAFGAYLRGANGASHGTGLFVLGLAGDRICALTRFENTALPWFGLPRSLP